MVEMDNDAPWGPRLGHPEARAVHARRVVFRDLAGPEAGPRHLDVGVVRQVAGVLQCPVGRHVDLAPRVIAGHDADGVVGDLFGTVVEGKPPAAIERLPPRAGGPVVAPSRIFGVVGDQWDPHRQAVDADDLGVEPGPGGTNLGKHPTSLSPEVGGGGPGGVVRGVVGGEPWVQAVGYCCTTVP